MLSPRVKRDDASVVYNILLVKTIHYGIPQELMKQILQAHS